MIKIHVMDLDRDGVGTPRFKLALSRGAKEPKEVQSFIALHIRSTSTLCISFCHSYKTVQTTEELKRRDVRSGGYAKPALLWDNQYWYFAFLV